MTKYMVTLEELDFKFFERVMKFMYSLKDLKRVGLRYSCKTNYKKSIESQSSI